MDDNSIVNIYEGEYLNGQRHGKGKEENYKYHFSNLLSSFEGEYLNGKKWNGNWCERSKKYGNLFFEYVKGKKSKKCKRYDCYNYEFLEFEADYLNGELTGEIKEYYFKSNDLLYEGECLNGKWNGKGKEYYWNGNIKFEGEYLEGKIWTGIGYNNTGQKEFEILNGNGYVKEFDSNGKLEYEGEYLNGKRHGKGKKYD